MKGSWTAADTWLFESPGESIGENAASSTVDNLWVESGMERRLVKVQLEAY